MLPQNKPTAPIFTFTFIIAIFLLIIGLALAWLCPSEETTPPVTEHEFEHGHAIWLIASYPAKALQSNSFYLDLTDLTGAPLQGANLAVNLEMTGMVCGDYEFKMTEVAAGKYSGEGIPLMAGIWKATLTLEANDETYTIVRRLKAIH